jgi:hypothetical protein
MLRVYYCTVFIMYVRQYISLSFMLHSLQHVFQLLDLSRNMWQLVQY